MSEHVSETEIDSMKTDLERLRDEAAATVKAMVKQKEELQTEFESAKKTSGAAIELLERIRKVDEEIGAAKNKLLGAESGDGVGLMQEVESELSILREKIELTEKRNAQIESVKEKIIDGSKEKKSYLAEIEAAYSKIDEILQETGAFYEKLAGKPKEGFNYKDAVKSFVENIRADSVSVRETREKIDSYRISLFGKENDKGELTGGLSSDIEKIKERFESYLKDTGARASALTEKIESLLPGATSAGLAKAYQERRCSCEKSKNIYSCAFLGCIAELLIFACFSDAIFSYFFSVSSADYTLLQRILGKILILAPLIWGATFAANRANEMTRLIEEYAHKETLAKSYFGFKKQVEDLQEENSELMQNLLKAAVASLAYNASATLDKVDKEDHPYFTLLKILFGKGRRNEQKTEALQETK